MYTKFCSVPEQQPEVCPNVGWLKDFNDPQAMLDLPFNGATIDPENNSNWPQLDVPEINKAIDEARLIDDPDERAQAWGEVDTTGQRAGRRPSRGSGTTSPNIQSADVAGRDQPVQRHWDLTFTSLK